jgi:hypothetical protein
VPYSVSSFKCNFTGTRYLVTHWCRTLTYFIFFNNVLLRKGAARHVIYIVWPSRRLVEGEGSQGDGDYNLLVKGTDPMIRILIRTKMLRIRNAALSSVGQRYGSENPDPYQNVTDLEHCLIPVFSSTISKWIRLRILLLSSVTFKMPTKKIFISRFLNLFLFEGTFLHHSSTIKCHEEVTKQ